MMKKVTAVAIIVFALFCVVPVMAADDAVSGIEKAADTQSAENIISANVWPFLGGFFNLGYERKIVDMLSVRVRGLYWSLFSTLSGGTSNFVGAGIDIFLYPQGKACKGWYLGPRVDMLYIGNSTGNLQIYTAGGQVGHRWLFEGGFAMGLALGGVANIANIVSTGYSDASGDVLAGFIPTFDFDLGWAF